MEPLQSQINTITNKYVCKQNINISIFYLLRDISVSISFTCAAYQIQKEIPDILLYKVLWLLAYSLGQGTIWTGLWVLGHECGHGAFAKTKLVNNVFGLMIHSFLLVPYYSWQYTHAKHHKYTNHLVLGETHVPFAKRELPSDSVTIIKKVKQILGSYYLPLNTMINIFFRILLGWPFYLMFNLSSGRIDRDERPKKFERMYDYIKYSHFNPYATIFPKGIEMKIMVNNACILLQLSGLYYMDAVYGRGTTLIWYWCPLIITNGWLVIYTILQHTDSKVPHYGTAEFTWLKGALCTIDRDYPSMIDEMHHYIGSTHVLHHLNYRIPFHCAKEATEELKKALGIQYKYDDTNFLIALYKAIDTCIYVDEIEGEQYYKKFF